MSRAEPTGACARDTGDAVHTPPCAARNAPHHTRLPNHGSVCRTPSRTLASESRFSRAERTLRGLMMGPSGVWRVRVVSACARPSRDTPSRSAARGRRGGGGELLRHSPGHACLRPRRPLPGGPGVVLAT